MVRYEFELPNPSDEKLPVSDRSISQVSDVAVSKLLLRSGTLLFDANRFVTMRAQIEVRCERRYQDQLNPSAESQARRSLQALRLLCRRESLLHLGAYVA